MGLAGVGLSPGASLYLLPPRQGGTGGEHLGRATLALAPGQQEAPGKLWARPLPAVGEGESSEKQYLDGGAERCSWESERAQQHLDVRPWRTMSCPGPSGEQGPCRGSLVDLWGSDLKQNQPQDSVLTEGRRQYGKG